MAGPQGLLARTVTIKVRYSDFTTITRSHTAQPTRDEAGLVERAVRLLDKTEAGRRPIRLLGVSVHNLGHYQGMHARAGCPSKDNLVLPSGYSHLWRH